MIERKRRAPRGVLLIEALVALFLVGIVVFFGLSLFARRRELEKERLDREIARRALASEWVYLRTSGGVTPRKDGKFVGTNIFLASIEARHPLLTLEGDRDTPGLLHVKMSIEHGLKRAVRLSDEGYVFTGAAN
ncbi:MAG TPA: hypothetical protein VGR00_04650 [Thermoanaerobaculia bacterium]|nr:hypothetical protein [Thermoanaerobaculia bacterium]